MEDTACVIKLTFGFQVIKKTIWQAGWNILGGAVKKKKSKLLEKVSVVYDLLRSQMLQPESTA